MAQLLLKQLTPQTGHLLRISAVKWLVMIGWLASDLKIISVHGNRLALGEGSHGQGVVFNHILTL